MHPSFTVNEQYCDYAEKSLANFANDFATLYGANQLVHNVHSVIYLVSDSRRFSPLDKISAFPFESFLGQMKKMKRRPQNLVAQIARRYEEKSHVSEYSVQSDNIFKAAVYSEEHFNGPVPTNFSKQVLHQYKHVVRNTVYVSVSKGNNCFAIHSKLSIIKNIILTTSDELYEVYQELVQNKSFFKFP